MHRIWKDIRTRCTNPNVAGFKNYGGKGVTRCAEWDSFESFRDWAVSAGYDDTLTIERKDNHLGYCPDNCCWTTKALQSVNRDFIRRAPDGTPWYQIANSNGISTPLFHGRVHDGWTDELAATKLVRRRKKG